MQGGGSGKRIAGSVSRKRNKETGKQEKDCREVSTGKGLQGQVNRKSDAGKDPGKRMKESEGKNEV